MDRYAGRRSHEQRGDRPGPVLGVGQPEHVDRARLRLVPERRPSIVAPRAVDLVAVASQRRQDRRDRLRLATQRDSQPGLETDQVAASRLPARPTPGRARRNRDRGARGSPLASSIASPRLSRPSPRAPRKSGSSTCEPTGRRLEGHASSSEHPAADATRAQQRHATMSGRRARAIREIPRIHSSLTGLSRRGRIPKSRRGRIPKSTTGPSRPT